MDMVETLQSLNVPQNKDNQKSREPTLDFADSDFEINEKAVRSHHFVPTAGTKPKPHLLKP